MLVELDFSGPEAEKPADIGPTGAEIGRFGDESLAGGKTLKIM